MNKIFFLFHVLHFFDKSTLTCLTSFFSPSKAHSFLYYHDSNGALGIKSQVVDGFLFVELKRCYVLLLVSVSSDKSADSLALARLYLYP